MRRSPVRFDAIPIETERRDGWEVVLSYGDQGDGPWLVDLSHRNRWDVQDREIERLRPFGLPVPEAGGGALIERSFWDGCPGKKIVRTPQFRPCGIRHGKVTIK